MKSFDQHDVLQELCKLSGKFGLFISIYIPDTLEDIRQVEQACLFLDKEKHTQIICDEMGYFLFDTEEEMEEHYQMCVGDDGPTKLNKYNGEIRVFALTCSNLGELWNENT